MLLLSPSFFLALVVCSCFVSQTREPLQIKSTLKMEVTFQLYLFPTSAHGTVTRMFVLARAKGAETRFWEWAGEQNHHLCQQRTCCWHKET